MGCVSSSFSNRIRMRFEHHFARRVPDAFGGGSGRDGRYTYGYASSQATRLHMEDYFDIRNESSFGYFAVYDGHHGKKAAEYLKDHLFNNIISRPNFINDTRTALVEAYDLTDENLLRILGKRLDGSTASTAVLFKNQLVVAHVGDSRVVISRKHHNSVQLTQDHHPHVSVERSRIEEAGGFVLYVGTHRVLGRLAVSRAFGDQHLKKFVPATPDIREEEVDESLECIIIASDGLWASISNQEAVDIVMGAKDAEEGASNLMKEGLERSAYDNIICIVVRFNH